MRTASAKLAPISVQLVVEGVDSPFERSLHLVVKRADVVVDRDAF